MNPCMGMYSRDLFSKPIEKSLNRCYGPPKADTIGAQGKILKQEDYWEAP